MSARRRQQIEMASHALSRLDEALGVPKTEPLAVDGTIQRFEYAFELVWKTARAVLLDQGVSAGSPRDVFRQIFKLGWIDDESLWLTMLEARNQSTRVYDEQMAVRIYESIPPFAEAFRRLVSVLQQQAD